MRVDNRVVGDRWSRQIDVISWPNRGHLRAMIVAMVAIGMRMDLSGHHASRNHGYQQQQAGQRPNWALDPDRCSVLEGSKRHEWMMPERQTLKPAIDRRLFIHRIATQMESAHPENQLGKQRASLDEPLCHRKRRYLVVPLKQSEH